MRHDPAGSVRRNQTPTQGQPARLSLPPLLKACARSERSALSPHSGYCGQPSDFRGTPGHRERSPSGSPPPQHEEPLEVILRGVFCLPMPIQIVAPGVGGG